MNQLNYNDGKKQKELLSYRPFFSIQPHLLTEQNRLKYWAEILHNYFVQNNIDQSSLSELDNYELFINRSTNIPKKLGKSQIFMILQILEKDGKIEWKNFDIKENFNIFKISPKNLANEIYKWADKNAKLNSVETLKWICEGDETDSSEKFYKLPLETILKSIKILQNEEKAQLIEIEPGKYSVKFLRK